MQNVKSYNRKRHFPDDVWLGLTKDPDNGRCGDSECDGMYSWTDGELYSHPAGGHFGIRTDSPYNCFRLETSSGAQRINDVLCHTYKRTAVCVAECLPDDI